MKILSHRSCMPSARILRDSLESITQKKIPVTTRPSAIKNGQEFIRYGNSSLVPDGKDLGLNQADLISISCNKFKFSELLSKGGFYVPTFNREINPEEFPVVVRSSLTLSKGKGIQIAENEEVFKEIWRSGYYWTPFVNMRYELRVHFFNGEILKVFRKSWRSDEEEEKYPIRTNEGYTFILQNTLNNRYEKLFTLIKVLHSKVLNKFHDYFLSLDVGWDANRKEYFIIEANSGPGLNVLTADLYAERIVKSLKI